MKTLLACLRSPLLNIVFGALFGLTLAVLMRLAVQRVFWRIRTRSIPRTGRR